MRDCQRPAFPTPNGKSRGFQQFDWIAIAAMQGILSNPHHSEISPTDLAAKAFQIATEMSYKLYDPEEE